MYRACVVGISLSLLTAGCSDRDKFNPDNGCIVGESCPTPTGLPDAMIMDASEDSVSDAEIDAPPLSGISYRFVLDEISLVSPNDQNELLGFNLDGRNSDAMDGMTCNRADRTAPLPDGFTGVDNELSPALLGLEGVLGLQESLEDAIASGDLLLMFDVRGVDALGNDDQVRVDALVGALPDGVDAPDTTNGRFAEDQYFEVQPDSLNPDGSAVITLEGQIQRGRLRTDSGSIRLPIPLADETTTLELQDAQIRFDITDKELSVGVMGGSLLVEDLVSAMVNAELITQSGARTILEDIADLRFEDGKCTAVSIGLSIRGVSAAQTPPEEN